MSNKIMKSLILLLHMPKSNKDFFHKCNHLFSNVNMIMSTMKYDTNKGWIIHNLNQQEVGNSRFFKTFSLKKMGNPHSIPKKI